ncbi:MAG: 4-(cytidine 5'-diphospho)-2-C-methyl-D-erythritol kinase [Firmicutes bacterium]|nr:4-(cytidine 5'-diphospho)-2-C-methyl-D-erythritol kinase [Bacillota bacterium]
MGILIPKSSRGVEMLLKAHAKINLLLDVSGIRPDGYHELITVMQSLLLGDDLLLEPAPEISLTVEGAELPGGPANLAWRAADLLRRRTGYRGGVAIRLNKRIPLAAGLAGGSADAAAVLRGLNKMWRLELGRGELSRLGAELGSDVPFCLGGGTALCRGRGELVTRLPALPAAGVLLVKPSFGVSTADVYRRYDAWPEISHPNSRRMLTAVATADLSAVAGSLGNKLEPVALAMHPEIGWIKEAVAAAGAAGVLMSGSGPTVFGLFPDQPSAVWAADRIKKDGHWVCATAFSAAYCPGSSGT